MPEKFQELLKQDFSDLQAASKSWHKLSKDLEEAQAQHRRKVTGALHACGWKGTDAQYAFTMTEDNERRLGTAQSDVSSIATILDGVHHTMEDAQRALRQAVRDAEANGFAVDDEGELTDTRYRGPYAPDAPGSQQGSPVLIGPGDAYRQRIESAIEEASRAAWQGMQLLQQIDAFALDKDYGSTAAQDGARKVAETYGLEEKDIPSGKNPRKNAEWWEKLTPEQKQMYIDAYPEKIGWLDGIPSTDRDEANRKTVDLSLAEYELKKQHGELGIQDQRMYEGLLKLQGELDKTDGTGNEHKRLFVLGVDTRSDGRAVVSTGNPDTADNTAIQVPGTGNDLTNVDEQIDRAGRLQRAAQANGSDNTAVVSWLGYDAPEADGSVATPGRANDRAEDLRNFTHGMRESHQGERNHMTVLGHSYGSTMVGAAASGDGGLDADDIVVVGSPGMTVDHAQDLNIDPDHVWAGWAPDDVVSTVFSDKSLGENPAEEGFGGKVIEVDTEGHSGYWDQGSRSLANQGAVIVGRSPGEGDFRVPPQPDPPGEQGPKW